MKKKKDIDVVRFSLALPINIDDKIRQMAFNNRLTKAEMIRQLLTTMLKK